MPIMPFQTTRLSAWSTSLIVSGTGVSSSYTAQLPGGTSMVCTYRCGELASAPACHALLHMLPMG